MNMRRLLPDQETVYRLQQYAIIPQEDGKLEYVAWEPNRKTGELSWIKGPAVIVEDTLCLASITSEGKEENMDSVLELKYELQQLPEFDKAKYFCVVVQGQACLLKYCGTGNPLKQGSQEFKMTQEMLQKHGLVTPTE